VQHENYIGGWLKRLREDKKVLFSTCRQAREATEFLLTPSADVEQSSPATRVA
jgi:antirestriction protein ArdC